MMTPTPTAPPPPSTPAPDALVAHPSPGPAGLLAWLHNTSLAGPGPGPGGSALTVNPYARDIFLLACHVAGTGYCDLGDLLSTLTPGRPLRLQREPDNPHDPLAILVLDAATARKLGYVPRNESPVLARLMDAGKTFVADLGTAEVCHGWHRLELRISLREL